MYITTAHDVQGRIAMSEGSGSKPIAHSLKWELRGKGVTLYDLRNRLGGAPSEGRLSRVLNGVEAMPSELEERIKTIIEQLN